MYKNLRESKRFKFACQSNFLNFNWLVEKAYNINISKQAYYKDIFNDVSNKTNYVL